MITLDAICEYFLGFDYIFNYCKSASIDNHILHTNFIFLTTMILHS